MRRTAPPTNAAPPIADGYGSMSIRPTVLVVDDDSAVLSVVSRILARGGMHVLRALGPEQALEHFDSDEHSIDLVVSDIMMPIMDGPQLIAKLRESQPQLNVVYMSALAYKYAHTIDEPLLQKPFSHGQLLDCVDKMLPRSKPSRR